MQLGEGFFAHYMNFCSGNECPEQFHTWSAFGALSSIISRRVWIDQGYFDVFPNLYILLVGQAGSGKSVAMNIAKEMVRELKIPLCSTGITKEALTKTMGGDESPCKVIIQKPNGEIDDFRRLTMFCTEFTHLLGKDPIGMIDFLTTVYDEKVYVNTTKNKGEDIIPGPYITLIGCMTPETTESYLKTKIIHQGFARRGLFVWADKRRRAVTFPKITDEMKQSWDKCIKWAKRLEHIYGKFQWSKEAYEFFDNWYTTFREAVTVRVEDPALATYFESKCQQVLRIAMLVTLSETTELIMKVEALQIALAFLAELEKTLPKVFETAGRNENVSLAAKIVAYVDAFQQGVEEKKLKRVMWADGGDDLMKVIYHLIETDQLKAVKRTYADGNEVRLYFTPKTLASLQK